jgi:hypothetical protein
MRATDLRVRGRQSRDAAFALGAFALIFLCWIGGCSVISPEAGMQQKVRLYDKDLSAVYDQTKIKKSLTLDVLPKMGRSKDELLSQSESVVASLGQSKDGYKTWFTMVAFHEYELSVVRKYFFVVDERVHNRARRGLRFDCEMLLDKEELDNIRLAKGARQVAVLKNMLDNLQKDTAELVADVNAPGQDNRMLDISVMLVKQVSETALLDLDRSPVLATKLSDPNGVQFDHLNFGAGKIRVQAEGNTVIVRIRLGALLPTFDELQEMGTVEQVAQPAKDE